MALREGGGMYVCIGGSHLVQAAGEGRGGDLLLGDQISRKEEEGGTEKCAGGWLRCVGSARTANSLRSKIYLFIFRGWGESIVRA